MAKKKTLRIDGKAIEVTPLGKGTFTKAYLGPGKQVYVISKDYAKEILANIHTPSRYIPKVQSVGWAGDAQVFKMPLYRAPFRKADNPKAWAQMTQLKKCLDQARTNVMRSRGRNFSIYDGHNINYELIECARKSGVTPGLVNALEILTSEMANYGADWTFEFPPRNLATTMTKSRTLVLLDVIFSQEEMAKLRKANRARRSF